MVKRKSTVPQKLGVEQRSGLTWDLNEPSSAIVCNDNSVEILENVDEYVTSKNNRNSKKHKRDTKCKVNDEYLKRLLDECSFYIELKKKPSLQQSERAFELGRLTVSLKVNSPFPEDGGYWLYVSELSNSSFLYVEHMSDIKYFLLNGTLDYNIYSGLSLNCFQVIFEGFISGKSELCLIVLLRESFCLGPTAHLEHGSTNRNFQAVISYFYGVEIPACGIAGEVRKHDIEILYKAVKDHHEDTPSDQLAYNQHSDLVPTLRPYQTRAVKWMLWRENFVKKSSDDLLHCLYTELVTPGGQLLFYNKYAGCICLEKPVPFPLPTGGILADEMGLGKTVEVLACLLANPRPESDMKRPVKKEHCTTKEVETVLTEGEQKPEILHREEIPVALNVPNGVDSHSSDTSSLQMSDFGSCTKNVTSAVSEDVKTSLAEMNEDYQLVDIDEDSSVAANVMVTTADLHDSVVAESNLGQKNGFVENCVIVNQKELNISESISGMGNENISLDSETPIVNEWESDQDVFNLYSEGDEEDDVNDEDWRTPKSKKTSPKKQKRKRKNAKNRPLVMFRNNISERGSKNTSFDNESLEVSEWQSDQEIFNLYSEDDEEDDLNDEDWGTPKSKKPTAKTYKRKGRNARKRSSVICMSNSSRSIQKRPRKVIKGTIEETIEEVVEKYCENGTNKRKSRLREVSSWRTACQMWYESMLSEMSASTPKINKERIKKFNLECVCGSEEDTGIKDKVCCSVCGKWQHAKCVAYNKHEKTEISDCYYCPQCWQAQEPIISGATLIVSPASICNQWVSEIRRHVKNENFSILVYRGVHKDGFLQPYDISRNCIVITTYETLRKELNYADLKTTGGHRFRHVKRFLAPPSPLPCIQWWRLCLDEAQMVESTGSKTAEMARRLGAVHRWAITGTPIQKTVQDLFGLVQFLGVDPYCVLRWWQDLIYGPYCAGNYKPLHDLMGQIMWRTAKKHVLHQINIPEQTEELEWLRFSPVEEYFYQRQHVECSQEFLIKLSKMHSLDITLDSLDRQTISRVLGPLLRLRQACSHPQAVRGQFLTATKATMSMEELLESLIKKTKNESEEALRLYIASLNGLAGIHIIKEKWPEAVETYRDVLRIAENYKDKLKTDNLQMIHTLHNLADMLDGHYAGVFPTLRDDKLREEAKALEQKYMQKCYNQVAAAQETLAGLSATVSELQNGFTVGRDYWWEELLAWLVIQGEETELLHKIREEFIEEKPSGRDSIINRISTIRGFEYELGTWSDAVQKARKKAVEELRHLEVTTHQDLVNGAVECHLRESVINNKNKKKCQLCTCESHLKSYESLIFAISKKQTEHSLVGEVVLLGQLNQGTWGPCEMERALRVLVSFVRGKRSSRECLEDGNQYLKLLDATKKEFRYLRLVWTQLRDQVSAQDELNMAKLRLRIRFPNEPIPQNNKKRNPLQQLSYNIKNVVETIHIIDEHQVSSHETRLISERAVSESDLRKKTGQLLYLENLRKSRGLESNPDPCPVCQTNLGDKWSVLQCGHCYCMECVGLLVEQTGSHRINVKCPLCRESTPVKDISYVNLGKGDEKQEDGTSVTVRGSHSTKVEAVVRRLLILREAEPNVKTLVFSTWEKVLEVLAHALSENGISFARLQPGQKYQEVLQNFKDSNSHVTALLLPLRWGAKGLNLVEATHVLLVEPILNPADELQAIGRVHRIGQTRKTVVHRFLVKGTVEERMYTAVRNSAEKWSGDKVTLRQLKDLFGPPNEEPNGTTELKCDKIAAPSVSINLQLASNTTETTTSDENGASTSYVSPTVPVRITEYSINESEASTSAEYYNDIPPSTSAGNSGYELESVSNSFLCSEESNHTDQLEELSYKLSEYY